LGYAVRRHEVRTASGALALVIQNSDFVKLTEPDLWLPRHSHADWHYFYWWPNDVSSKPFIVVDLQVTRLERSRVPAERFTLKYEPGSLVSDAGLPAGKNSRDGRVDYILPKNPADLKGTIQAAQQGVEYVPPRSFLALWIVGSGLLLWLAAMGVFVWVNRRRRGRAVSPSPGVV
jgi:hypothetical protein